MRPRGAAAFAVFLGLGSLLLACEGGPRVDSQTHWLKPCAGPEDCGRLECLCGYCSQRCDADAQCAGTEPASSCFGPTSAASLGLCFDAGAPSGICLTPCGHETECPAEQMCWGGACVPRAVGAGKLSALGEPVGPLQASFPLPEEPRVAAPDGQGTACTVAEPCSLEEAVARAPSGATVVLRGGVYRTGDLRLNKEIALQPFLDEVPVLDGSRELTNVSQNAGVWTAALEQLPATGDAGQPPVSLWIDDVPLLPAASVAELAAGSFFFDPDAGTVSWVDDPAGKRVEASVFSHAIERVYWELPNVPGPPDEAGLVIRGLTFRRYALTALWLRAAGAQVEHCRFVDGGGQGILAFRGQSVIRFNEFTGQRGAAANLVEFGGGTFSHNWLTGNSWESGGGSDTARVAVFSGGTGGLVRSNLLLDNGGHGLWVGGDPQGHAVLENVVDGCDAPEGSGINLNGGYDTLVAGNVVARCPFGVRVTNTSGSQLYNNTLVNTGNPVQVREYLQDTVVGGPGNSARTTLVNNVFWGATNTEWPWALLTVQSSLCGEHELIAELDHNGYFQTDAGVPTYAIAWDPLPSAGEQNAACADQTQEHFEEVAAFASATGWETHGLSGRTSEAVFEDPAAREPAPRAGGPLHRAGSRLPETVLRSLGWDDRDAPDLGAVQTSR